MRELRKALMRNQYGLVMINNDRGRVRAVIYGINGRVEEVSWEGHTDREGVWGVQRLLHQYKNQHAR